MGNHKEGRDSLWQWVMERSILGILLCEHTRSIITLEWNEMMVMIAEYRKQKSHWVEHVTSSQSFWVVIKWRETTENNHLRDLPDDVELKISREEGWNQELSGCAVWPVTWKTSDNLFNKRKNKGKWLLFYSINALQIRRKISISVQKLMLAFLVGLRYYRVPLCPLVHGPG